MTRLAWCWRCAACGRKWLGKRATCPACGGKLEKARLDPREAQGL